MKKSLWVLVMIPLMFFESCRDDFNINAPQQEIYVLNCILRNDTTIQYAVISHNRFTENGSTPPSDNYDESVKNAEIKIFYNDSVFVLRDTTIQLNETLINCYYINNLVIKSGKVIKIEASIPDGTKLESTIKVPEISYANFSSAFPQAGSGGYMELPYYGWGWAIKGEANPSIMCIPQLEIYYQKYEEGVYADKKIFIPLGFYLTYDDSGNLLPVGLKYSFNNFCVTTLEAVNITMQKISEDDPYKNNYIINKVLLNVISMDPELSKYYSAYDVYSGDFTIKLRTTDFSNINGGKGIFGAYYKFTKSLTIDSLYVSSFGYRFDPMK